MFLGAIHLNFTGLDWAVLIGYLLITTWVGHVMKGKNGTIKDFFLGGRSLPWWAVSGSIIATEISGVTFIGVPGTLFALDGDFTYMQWGIGSILARFLVARWFVKVYYEQEIYSPYDYMGNRLGNGAKMLATVMFTLGSVLGQSVRVLVAAIPLKVVTGLPIELSILIIGVIAIGWTLMGGMQTVIWTDVMQFLLFAIGGTVALLWLINGVDDGWSGFWETATRYDRLKTWDFTWGIRSELEFTFWVAIFAVPFQNLTAFGVDQLNAQRMFCCKDAKQAGKALIFSSFGQVLTLLMLMVGAALFVYYNENPFTGDEASLVKVGTDMIGSSNVPVVGERDFVFPMWIVTMLPAGVSGLLLAGIFAACISSLDSILAALSQTTLSAIYSPEKKSDEELSKMNLIVKTRWLIIGWGVALTCFTLLLNVAREGIPILGLAFGMTAYTMGPLLGLMFCALTGRASIRGLYTGCGVSLLLVALIRTDIWVLWIKAGGSFNWLAQLPTYRLNEAATGIESIYHFSWAWPLTTAITFCCGYFLASPVLKKPS
ncbi:MAG: sodium:solute symporter family transporter [Luteolibacter sp.]